MSARRRRRESAPIERHLARLRRRARSLYALRATAAGAGAAALTFALLSALTGPVIGWGWAGAGWLLVVGAGTAAGWAALRGVPPLRGPGAASLLRGEHRELASEARSAVELTSDPRAHQLAPELVSAHARRAEEALRYVRPAHVVPWRSVRHPAALGGAAAALLAAALFIGFDRVPSGAWALVHPGIESEDGLALAAVVGNTEARLSFPAYMDREPEIVRDTGGLEAPRGTSVQYAVRPRVEAQTAVLQVAGRDVRLVQRDDGWFAGRFVVRKGGPLHVRVRRPDGHWLQDPGRRWIRAVEDQQPRISLTRPETDRTVELGETVPVEYDASDDVGLRKVELVVKTTAGREVRRGLAQFETGTHRRQVGGRTDLTAAEFDARPGDRLELWIEARDGDVVAGPNVGRSNERKLTVASESSRRLERIADLERALDRGLAALADRLERPVPEPADEAKGRLRVVQDSGKKFAGSLERLAERADDEVLSSVSNPPAFRSMARRIHGLQRKEASAHGDRPAPLPRRAAIDDRLVERLEDDTLELADLIGQARLEDAAEITRELEKLRREMSSLLAELRRTENPKARQKLMAALARAEQRMRGLMQRLAQMGEDVPSDFVNTGALKQEKSQNALSSMREALERGDLSEAERQLMEFERRITAMAEALGSAEQSFAQARFGPRQKALAEAMDRLAGLESEQRQLARRSEEVRRGAAERALEASGALDREKTERISQKAGEARRALRSIDRSRLGPMERETLDRAKQRLRDVQDALQAGDLGEARRMAREGNADLERLSRDLELSSLMFPGHQGQASDAAEAGKRASRNGREVRRALDEALPRVDRFVDEGGRQRMRKDAKRQREAERTAEKLQERLEEGPDGAPLAPDAVEGMKEARKRMDEARGALREGDPLDAARAQEEAARKLTELREQLEKNRRNQSRSGRRGNREGGLGRTDPRRRVEIPGSDAHESPTALRRRLLDAMREDTPDGYEKAVRRYYEELLR